MTNLYPFNLANNPCPEIVGYNLSAPNSLSCRKHGGRVLFRKVKNGEMSRKQNEDTWKGQT